MLSVLVMSCLHFASRTTRAQDSFQIIGSQDLSLEADTAPPFYAFAGRGFTPTKTEENVPPHPFPELPEGPKSPLYFTAPAQYGPDVPAVRFRAAGRPFLGRGTGERPHAARSGAAGVNKTLSVTSTIPHSGCSRQALRRKRSLKSGSRGGLRIEFFLK